MNPIAARAWPDGIARIAMDVTNAAEVDAAVASVVERFGRIDVLVNNAGIYPRQHADVMTFESWRHVLDVNLDGTWRCVQAVIPALKGGGGGVIINVGSIALRLGMPHLAHYNASKGGIVGLTRALARDLGRFSIRVNCIHLGAVMTEGERRTHGDPAEALRLVEEKQALRGRLTPGHVETAFAFSRRTRTETSPVNA